MERIKIGITQGDINGIGYEIILKGIADPHICEICTPVIYGNQQIAREHLKLMDEEMRNMQFSVIQSAKDVRPGKINLINVYPDEDSIYHTLEHLVLNPESIPLLQKQSIEYVKKHHDYIDVAKKYMDVYESLFK